jgi:hypothetical protein
MLAMLAEVKSLSLQKKDLVTLDEFKTIADKVVTAKPAA